MSLEFAPLYWIYHDGWHFKESKVLLDSDGDPIDASKDFHHGGHIHLFLMDYNPEDANSDQSYWGEQTYQFELEDVWGANSNDPNQSHPYRLIGKPVWYFYIEEYWRRMYVQPWEKIDPKINNQIHNGKGGIKYDASKPQHSLGPFREGGEFYFFNPTVNRTMPIEYWHEPTKHTRDYYLKNKKSDFSTGGSTWTFDRLLFDWTFDTHPQPNYWGAYEPFVQHRLRNTTSDDYYWYFGGTNAKRLKVNDNNFTPEEETDEWKNRDWTGWYEYKEIVKYEDEYYVREWRPTEYDETNFDIEQQPCYTETKRQHFPNPPPNETNKSILYWEYLHYFDKVKKHHNQPHDDNWENKIDQYKLKHNLIELNEQQEQDCFDEYISELGYDFFSQYMPKKINNILQIPNDRTPIYLTFEEFCNVWRKLTPDEIKKLNLNGDYPIQLKPIPDDLTQSDFYPKQENPEITDAYGNALIHPYDKYQEYFDKIELYTIPRNKTVKGDKLMTHELNNPNSPLPHPREMSYSKEDGARRFVPDDEYISPIIEYQKVIHANWERLPNKKDDEDFFQQNWRTTNQDFGDGFKVTITIPFKKNHQTQSPFSDNDKVCQPIGTYCNNVVKPEDKIRYHVEWHDSIEQLRKYDLIEYIKMIQDFQNIYPNYQENFHEAPNKYWNTKDENDQPWINRLKNHFNQTNQIKQYDKTPVTRRTDENQFDQQTQIWREQVTETAVTTNQVEIPHYHDSQGNTVKGGKVVTFNNPHPNQTDGKWTEQCLGAIVKAKIVIVLEDRLGHRWQETIEATQLKTNQPIKGKDHGK